VWALARPTSLEAFSVAAEGAFFAASTSASTRRRCSEVRSSRRTTRRGPHRRSAPRRPASTRTGFFDSTKGSDLHRRRFYTDGQVDRSLGSWFLLGHHYSACRPTALAIFGVVSASRFGTQEARRRTDAEVWLAIDPSRFPSARFKGRARWRVRRTRVERQTVATPKTLPPLPISIREVPSAGDPECAGPRSPAGDAEPHLAGDRRPAARA